MKLLRLALPVLHTAGPSGKVQGFRRGGQWFYSKVELMRLR